MARHRLALEDEILQHLVQGGAHVDVAVGEGRSVVEDELRRSGGAALLDDAAVEAALLPAGAALGLSHDEIPPHRKGGVGEVQGRLVGGGAVGFAHGRAGGRKGASLASPLGRVKGGVTSKASTPGGKPKTRLQAIPCPPLSSGSGAGADRVDSSPPEKPPLSAADPQFERRGRVAWRLRESGALQALAPKAVVRKAGSFSRIAMPACLRDRGHARSSRRCASTASRGPRTDSEALRRLVKSACSFSRNRRPTVSRSESGPSFYSFLKVRPGSPSGLPARRKCKVPSSFRVRSATICTSSSLRTRRPSSSSDHSPLSTLSSSAPS